MLSVTQSAEQLGVSPARVRALIKSGKLAATKSGGIWMLQEEDVLQRLLEHPKPGRPNHVTQVTPPALSLPDSQRTNFEEVHDIYISCRRIFSTLPSREMMQQASSKEEASFYMAISDFFLQQKQSQLISQGVY